MRRTRPIAISKRVLRAVLPFVLASTPAMVSAAPICRVPAILERPHGESASADQPARAVPIGRYTLALIWTPQHCRHAVPGAESFRCTGKSARGFTLHGLWPDGEGKTWPQWCRPAEILPEATIRAHYCATPSPQLLQHEWAKHGTCIADATPETYFDQSNRLFAAIRAPDMAALSRSHALTAGRFTAAFASVNPGLGADMIHLNLDRDGWLQEVWICLGTRFAPQACPAPPTSDGQIRIWRGPR